MKHYILLLIASLLLFFDSYPQSTFEIIIDTDEDFSLKQSEIDSYGSVLVTGSILTLGTTVTDAVVFKIGPEGDYQMKRFDYGDTLCLLNTVNILNNDNYFLTGHLSLEGNTNMRKKLWCLILDSDLNVLVEKTYNIRQPYISFSSFQNTMVDNTGRINLSQSVLDSTNRRDLLFYKFSQCADTMLSQCYQFPLNEYSYDFTIIPESDNYMLLEASSIYNGHPEVMILDTNFTILNIDQFGEDGRFGGLRMCTDYWQSPENFLLCAMAATPDRNDDYIGVYSLDLEANILQELILNKVDTADYTAKYQSMSYANDSTIYIGGYENILGFWILEPTIVELYLIDNQMNLLGYKELGNDASYELSGVVATNDGGCLLYGERFNNPHLNEYDPFFWKILREDIGIITTIGNVKDENNHFKVFPNPVSDAVNITIPGNLVSTKVMISIFSNNGKKMYEETVVANGNLISTNISNLKHGLYGLVISHKSKTVYSSSIIKN